MFYEIEDEKKEEVVTAIGKKLRPGANIMVMGVGGCGRNVINSMREMGIDESIKLVAIDTDMGGVTINNLDHQERH